MGENQEDVGRVLTQGLQLLLSGDLSGGLASYARAFDAPPMATGGVGLHVRMLEQSGRQAEASALQRMAVARGADVNLFTLADADPARALEEYARHFAEGRVNAWMVSRYLIRLSQMDQLHVAKDLLDVERRVIQVDLDLPDPTRRHANLADAVAATVLEHEAEAEHQHQVQSVREMLNLRGLQHMSSPVFQTLIAHIRREVQRVIETPPATTDPIEAWRPSEFDLRVWALTSRGTGFNTPHVHHQAWHTAVYYATGLPDDCGDGGVLRLGRPPEAGAAAAGWPDLSVRPRPGLLVIFPSYYTHWTEPLGRPGLRVSVAADVVERGAASAEGQGRM